MCSVAGDAEGKSCRSHERILSQIPILRASLKVLSPSCTIENVWRAEGCATADSRHSRKSYEVQLRRQCVRSAGARHREAMKTATPLEQRGAIRFRPLRPAMDWYGCTFEWIGHPDVGTHSRSPPIRLRDAGRIKIRVRIHAGVTVKSGQIRKKRLKCPQ